MTMISPGPRWRLAAMRAAARGPFASQAPRPYNRPSSRRTGNARSTVSMWPRKRMVGGPLPIWAIAFPTASERGSRPRPRASSRNRCTASPSSPEGLYSSRRARRTSTSSMGQRPPEGVQSVRPLLLRDDEGRQEADDTGSTTDRKDALFLQRLEDRSRLSPQFDADHQTEPANFAHGGRLEPPQFLDADDPKMVRAIPQALSHGVFDRRRRRGTRERIPAERGIVAPLERTLHVLCGEGRSDRDAAREGLRQREQVRLHAPPLHSEQ